MVRTRKAIYVGNQEVQRRHIGNKLIFEKSGDMEDRDKVSGVVIFTDRADNSVVHVDVDGKSYQDGVPTPDYPIEIHSVNDFDVVSSVGKRNMINKVETEKVVTDIYFDSKMVVGKTYVLSFDFEFPEHVTRPEHFRIFDLQGATVTNTNLSSLGVFDVPSGRKGIAHVYFTLTSEYTGTNTSSGNPLKMRIHHGYSGGGYVEATLSNLKLEEGSNPTAWVPHKEDITEDSNHPLINKINLLLDEPLRSVGDVKDRLFRDSDGLWKIERNVEVTGTEDGTQSIADAYSPYDVPVTEVLSGEYQNKLSNLRSFQGSNYVYTISDTDISPTLHATFKSKGWYEDYLKTLLK